MVNLGVLVDLPTCRDLSSSLLQSPEPDCRMADAEKAVVVEEQEEASSEEEEGGTKRTNTASILSVGI